MFIVLSSTGRGAPANSNEGNKRFRDLVQSRKREYMSTGKRHTKDRIAREIVDTIIHDRQGRFVRKIESLVEAEEMGVPDGCSAWTIVSLDVAVQKTKQALRDRDFIDSGTMPASAEFAAAAADEMRRRSSGSAASEEAAAAAAAAAGARDSASAQAAAMYASAACRSFPLASSAAPSHQDVTNSVGDYLRSLRAVRTGTVPAPPAAAAASHAWQQQGQLQPGPASYHQDQRTMLLSRAAAAQAAHQNLVSAGVIPQAYEALPAFLLQSSPVSSRPVLPGAGATVRGGGLAPLNRSYAGYHSVPATEDNLSIANQRLERDPTLSMSLTGGIREASLGGGAPGQRFSASGSVLPTASATAWQESAGEMALRLSHERITGIREPTPRQSYLELSLIEVHILHVLCSHGLPVWTKTSHEIGSSSDSAVASPPTGKESADFTWRKFARVLVNVATEWNDDDRSRRSTVLFEDSTISARASHSALNEAAHLDIAANTNELVTKVIMLMETLHCFARDGANSNTRTAIKKANYEFWLEEELCRWASSLDLVGDGGRPVPYSSHKFLDDTGLHGRHRQHEAFCTMGMFDLDSCQDMFAQIACITRLRSVVEKCKQQPGPMVQLLQAKIMKVLSDLDKSNRAWRSKPAWWDDETCRYDLLLVRKIIKEGFRGVLSSKFAGSGSGEREKALPPKKAASSPAYTPSQPGGSFQQLGLTKARIQDRLDQLVEFLHIQQVSEDRRAVQDVCNKRMLAQLLGAATTTSPSTGAVSASAAPATTALVEEKNYFSTTTSAEGEGSPPPKRRRSMSH